MGEKTTAEDDIIHAPTPVGHHLLVALPSKLESKVLHILEETNERMRAQSVVGYVLDMGADAYKDTARFPTGPWCKTGDYILFSRYQGSRFKFDDIEYRLLNDDLVLAVVDPSAIERVKGI